MNNTNPIGRKCVVFDENFVASLSWLVERDEQQVHVDRETVHADNFVRVSGEKFGK